MPSLPPKQGCLGRCHNCQNSYVNSNNTNKKKGWENERQEEERERGKAGERNSECHKVYKQLTETGSNSEQNLTK